MWEQKGVGDRKYPCSLHKEYKKGCKFCFEQNNRDVFDDDEGDRSWILPQDMGDQ